MFDRLCFTLSLHQASICVQQEDEITRLTQLSELQREEIIGMSLPPNSIGAVSYTSLLTQLRGEFNEFDEINHEAEKQVGWLYQLFNPRIISPLITP
jgi:hypothetical protein